MADQDHARCVEAALRPVETIDAVMADMWACLADPEFMGMLRSIIEERTVLLERLATM